LIEPYCDNFKLTRTYCQFTLQYNIFEHMPCLSQNEVVEHVNPTIVQEPKS